MTGTERRVQLKVINVVQKCWSDCEQDILRKLLLLSNPVRNVAETWNLPWNGLSDQICGSPARVRVPPPNFAGIDVEMLQSLVCCQTVPQFPHSIEMFLVLMVPSNLGASCSNSVSTKERVGRRRENVSGWKEMLRKIKALKAQNLRRHDEHFVLAFQLSKQDYTVYHRSIYLA